jgi:hypothetical protein
MAGRFEYNLPNVIVYPTGGRAGSVESGFVAAYDRIVLFITGSGYKYLDVLEQGI